VLEIPKLRAPSIDLHGEFGCGTLSQMDGTQGENKSMHTAKTATVKGMNLL